MATVDKIYADTCRKILSEGYSDENDEVRPRWEDGTPAHTVFLSPVVNTYDLQKDGFPILSLRRTYWKSALDELLWIYQKKSNNIHDLNSHVWDSWADASGSIGKAYGYQIGQLYVCPDVTEEGLQQAFPGIEFRCDGTVAVLNGNVIATNGKVVAMGKHGEKTPWMMDQMNKVLYDLKVNPASRRIMTNTFVHGDLAEMGLAPCAYSTTWTVTGEYLNVLLNQRSQDMLAAGAWNVTQYALLLVMVAQVTGYKPGKLTHVIANCHIYDRHIDMVKELIEMPDYPAPVLKVNPDVKDFYAFTKQDFELGNYQSNPFDHKIPVAI
jgi:thymidylate synthase